MYIYRVIVILNRLVGFVGTVFRKGGGGLEGGLGDYYCLGYMGKIFCTTVLEAIKEQTPSNDCLFRYFPQ